MREEHAKVVVDTAGVGFVTFAAAKVGGRTGCCVHTVGIGIGFSFVGEIRRRTFVS